MEKINAAEKGFTLVGDIDPTSDERLVILKNNNTRRLYKLTGVEGWIWRELHDGKKKESIREELSLLHKEFSIRDLHRFENLLKKEGLLNDGDVRILRGNSEEIKRINSNSTRNQLIGYHEISDRAASRPLTTKLNIWLWQMKEAHVIGYYANKITNRISRWRTFLATMGVIIFAIGISTVLFNFVEMLYDIKASIRPDFGGLITASVFVDIHRILSSCASSGVAWKHGIKIKQVGYALYCGIIPSFLIIMEKRSIGRSARFKIAIAGIVVRFWVTGLCIICWYANRDTYTDLNRLLLIAALTGLGGIFMEANPLWPSDGYDATTAILGIDDIYMKGLQFIGLGNHREYFKNILTSRQRVLMLISGSLGALLILSTIVGSVIILGNGLGGAISEEIMREGTRAIIFLGLVLVLFIRIIHVIVKSKSHIAESEV